jgi:hypothetical protein
MNTLKIRRCAGRSGLVLACVTLGAAVVPGSALASQVAQAFVTNDDAHSIPIHSVGTSQVAGTVTVGNLPVKQAVSGTVDIGNLPDVQKVTGTLTAAGTTYVLPNGSGQRVVHAASVSSVWNLDAAPARTVKLFMTCVGSAADCADVTVTVFNSLPGVDNFVVDNFSPSSSSQLVKTYEIPGPDINMNMGRAGYSGEPSGDVTIKFAFVGRTD